jgi:hypothetical protein
VSTRLCRAAGVVASALLVVGGLDLVGAQPQPPQEPPSDYVRQHFTKYEYLIRARDGAKLFTSVYVPKTCDAPYPILMNRTPYSVGPYGVDQYRERIGPSDKAMKEGFVFAYQDVRGRYMSDGTWIEVRPHNPAKRAKTDTDESTDTWDTIDWLVKHVPCNNGRVGMWGVSYPGFYVSAGMIDAHPALVAASPQAPVTDYYLGDDSFHNGAFMLAANFSFYSAFTPRGGEPAPPPQRVPFNYGTPDGYQFYLGMGSLWDGAEKHGLLENQHYRLNLEHTTYDEFWRARSIWRHFKNITPAVLTVGGWYDAEDLMGPLRTYRTLEADSPKATHHLVMGPWTHGGWSRGPGSRVGNVDVGQPTGEFYRDSIEFPFFMRHLKGKTDLPALSEAIVFETGTNRWRNFDAWPPNGLAKRTWYLREAGQLAPDVASAQAEAYDEYLSDPARPVPYVGHVQMGMQGDYMTEDQRFAATRPDVLVYQTPVLEEDLTVLGPLGVTLHVSTSGTDSDFVVKVIDVFPPDLPTPEWKGRAPRPANHVRMGGYQQLVRGEPFRGKFRRSFEKPEPFVPNTPDVIAFELGDVAHTFRRGHRLMVQVQSSWFPLTDRNPQTFTDIPRAKPEDFKAATQRVYRSAARASAITMMVEPQHPETVAIAPSPARR